MTRFVVDCETLLRIAAGEIRVAGDIVQFGSRWPLPEGPVAVIVIVGLILLRAILVWLAVSAAELLARTDRTRMIPDEVQPIRCVPCS